MKLFVDVGNTRTKWCLADSLQPIPNVSFCLNEDISETELFDLAAQAKAIVVSNVAGRGMEQALIKGFAPSKTTIRFIRSIPQACGVTNLYQPPESLGVDRWLTLIAAYDLMKSSCLVVNAGTAVTLDALHVSPKNYAANFIGGLIMPGLHLMQLVLNTHTAQLPKSAGHYVHFARNTQDAIYSGCLNALLGSVQHQWDQLVEQLDHLPTLLLSGGDAPLIKEYLPEQLLKHAVIVDNLVLRGLMRLEREVA